VKTRLILLVLVLVVLVAFVTLSSVRARNAKKLELELVNESGVTVSVTRFSRWYNPSSVSLLPEQIWTFQCLLGDLLRAEAAFGGLRLSTTNGMLFGLDDAPARVKGVIYIVREIRDTAGRIQRKVFLPTPALPELEAFDPELAGTNLWIVLEPIWVPQ
jgi:hypothetical protein